MKRNNLNITTTDLLILTAILEFYHETKRPVTIPDLSEKLGMIYTTIRYSIDKLYKLGILDKKIVTNSEGQKVTGYIPKRNIVVILPKAIALIILEKHVIPLYLKEILESEKDIKIINLSEANNIIKAIVNDILTNYYLFYEYRKFLKREYLKILVKQYEKIKQLSEF